MLAVARAMGETAPLLLTTLGNDLFMETNPGNRMSTLSLQIFGSATGGFPSAQARAWAGALVLITIVLLLTILARLVSRRSTLQQMTTPERPDLMDAPSASGTSTNGALPEPAPCRESVGAERGAPHGHRQPDRRVRRAHDHLRTSTSRSSRTR